MIMQLFHFLPKFLSLQCQVCYYGRNVKNHQCQRWQRNGKQWLCIQFLLLYISFIIMFSLLLSLLSTLPLIRLWVIWRLLLPEYYSGALFFHQISWSTSYLVAGITVIEQLWFCRDYSVQFLATFAGSLWFWQTHYVSKHAYSHRIVFCFFIS